VASVRTCIEEFRTHPDACASAKASASRGRPGCGKLHPLLSNRILAAQASDTTGVDKDY